MAKEIKKFRNKTDARERVQQSFDREKIFIVRYGKKINQYDSIQAARTDTEIYPTLEKYGCIENALTVMNDPAHREEVFAEFKEMRNMRDIHERQRAADNLWESLPRQIRKEFNHDPLEFMQNGEKWLKNFAEQKQKEMAANISKNEVANNEPQHK